MTPELCKAVRTALNTSRSLCSGTCGWNLNRIIDALRWPKPLVTSHSPVVAKGAISGFDLGQKLKSSGVFGVGSGGAGDGVDYLIPDNSAMN